MPSLSPEILSAPRLLLRPGQVLLPEGFAADIAVLVENGRFAAVGPAPAILAANADLVPIDLPDHALMPGFIDAHHHLTQAIGKSLAFGEPSEIFRRIWVPMESHLGGEMAGLSAKLAALEALRGGFTTVVDAGTRHEGDLDPIAMAVREAGLRTVLGLICNDAAGTEPADPAPILARAERHLARWGQDSLIHPSLAISIPEVATDAMLHRVASLCAEAGVPFQTHANEHLVAVERSLVARGLRPVEHLRAAGALNASALLAHATLVTPREIGLLRDSGAAVTYCPVASQWKGNAVAPATAMLEMGVPLALGTDATRSDAFRLLDAAEASQRLAYGIPQGDFSCGGGWPWMVHATAASADALGLGAVTGRVAPGLAADFLLVDLAVPELVPSRDLMWELTRFGNRDQIEAVFVAGRLRLWHGWPLDWDARATMREVASRAGAAVAGSPIVKIHPVSAAHRAAAASGAH